MMKAKPGIFVFAGPNGPHKTHTYSLNIIDKAVRVNFFAFPRGLHARTFGLP
jgi:hypothetical protein